MDHSSHQDSDNKPPSSTDDKITQQPSSSAPIDSAVVPPSSSDAADENVNVNQENTSTTTRPPVSATDALDKQVGMNQQPASSDTVSIPIETSTSIDQSEQTLTVDETQTIAIPVSADGTPVTAAHLKEADDSQAQDQQNAAQITPGELLQSARERLQLTVASVAQHLKLNRAHIDLIEANNYTDINMPAIFIKGHLKLYAQHVKVDPEYVLRCYAQMSQPERPVKNAKLIIMACDRYSAARKRLSKRWLIIDGAIILFIILMAAWYMHANDRSSVMLETALAPKLTSPQTEAKQSVVHKKQAQPYTQKFTLIKPKKES